MSSLSTTRQNQQIGARLAAVRSQEGIGQNEFAMRLGISPRAYQNYERGEREIPSSFLTALHETFGIDPLWVLTGPDATPIRSCDRVRPDLRSQVESIVDNWLRRRRKVLPSQKRKRIVELLHERAQLTGHIEVEVLDAADLLAA